MTHLLAGFHLVWYLRCHNFLLRISQVNKLFAFSREHPS